MDKPDYAPPTKQAVWLSSADVIDAIRRVGMARESDTARATCWDVKHEIYKLIEASHG